MSAIFNFQSLLTVVLLIICTCAYLKSFFPKMLDKSRTGITIGKGVVITEQVVMLSAIFNFQSLLTVVLLIICTCAYLKSFFPKMLDKSRTGVLKTCWKCARIGERKSPWVGATCLAMAFWILFIK